MGVCRNHKVVGSIPCWGIFTNTVSDYAVSCELIVVDVHTNESICVDINTINSHVTASLLSVLVNIPQQGIEPTTL